MLTDTDRRRLDQLHREFGQYAGKGGLALELGDVYRMRQIARKIEAFFQSAGNTPGYERG